MRRMLVLSPVDRGPGLPGSAEITAECGHACVIAATGLMALMTDHDLHTVCGDCVDLSRAGGFGMVPGALQELAAELGAETALMVQATVRRMDRKRRKGKS